MMKISSLKTTHLISNFSTTPAYHLLQKYQELLVFIPTLLLCVFSEVYWGGSAGAAVVNSVALYCLFGRLTRPTNLHGNVSLSLRFLTTAPRLVPASAPLPPPGPFSWRGVLYELLAGCVATALANFIGYIPFFGPWLALLLLILYGIWRCLAYRAEILREAAIIHNARRVRDLMIHKLLHVEARLNSRENDLVKAEKRLKSAEAKLLTVQQRLSRAKGVDAVTGASLALEQAEKKVFQRQRDVTALREELRSLIKDRDDLSRHTSSTSPAGGA